MVMYGPLFSLYTASQPLRFRIMLFPEGVLSSLHGTSIRRLRVL